MAHLKFHADTTTLRDIQQAFGGPGKFTLRATDSGDLHAYGKFEWTRHDLMAWLGSVVARDRLAESGEKATELIQRAIDNEFGRGVGALSFARAQEKKRDQPISLADLRSAAEEVAPELAQQRMGASLVRLLTETFGALGIGRERLKDGLPDFVQAMSKAVLALKRPPARELDGADFQRVAQGALLDLLFRCMAEEAGGKDAGSGRLLALEARMASFFQPGGVDVEVDIGAAYRMLAEACGFDTLAR